MDTFMQFMGKRYNQIKHLPERTEDEKRASAKARLLRAGSLIAEECQNHAECNKSDPFALGRAMAHHNNGVADSVDSYHADLRVDVERLTYPDGSPIQSIETGKPLERQINRWLNQKQL